jgi:hypothetical protein
MKHGKGYCHLHGKRRKFTYPQCLNYVQSDGVCVQHGYKKKNAVTADAPTMPSGMMIASIMVQSAIPLSLSVASRCFRHGSADFTSKDACWWHLQLIHWQRKFQLQQMQWLVCAMRELLPPHVVLLVDKFSFH